MQQVGRRSARTRHTTAFTVEALATAVRAALVPPPHDLVVATGAVEVPWLPRSPRPVDAWVYGLRTQLLGAPPSAAEGEVLAAAAGDDPVTLPQSAVDAVLHSEAGRAQRGDDVLDDVLDLDTAYVVGCYLVAIGRRPDPGGLEAHLGLLRDPAGGQRAVLDALMASAEARAGVRHPPPPVASADVAGELVQLVVWGTVRPADTVALGEVARQDPDLRRLVRTSVGLRTPRLRRPPHRLLEPWRIARLRTLIELRLAVGETRSAAAFTGAVVQQTEARLSQLLVQRPGAVGT